MSPVTAIDECRADRLRPPARLGQAVRGIASADYGTALPNGGQLFGPRQRCCLAPQPARVVPVERILCNPAGTAESFGAFGYYVGFVIVLKISTSDPLDER